MTKLLSTVLLAAFTMTASATLAQTVPADLDAAKWEQLISKARAEGEMLDGGEMGILMVLTRKTPLEGAKGHQADYFSTVGRIINDKYVPIWVSVVSETWRVNADGHWDIDQWIYYVDLYGALYDTKHITMIITQESRVLEHVGHPVDAEDPAEVARWGRMASEWMGNL